VLTAGPELRGARRENVKPRACVDHREPTTWRPLKVDCARVDDDWYYEIVALRALEKYGIDTTGRQACIRLFQLILSRAIPAPGSAYWRGLRLD
jgi:hypothetical protein